MMLSLAFLSVTNHAEEPLLLRLWAVCFAQSLVPRGSACLRFFGGGACLTSVTSLEYKVYDDLRIQFTVIIDIFM